MTLYQLLGATDALGACFPVASVYLAPVARSALLHGTADRHQLDQYALGDHSDCIFHLYINP